MESAYRQYLKEKPRWDFGHLTSPLSTMQVNRHGVLIQYNARPWNIYKGQRFCILIWTYETFVNVQRAKISIGTRVSLTNSHPLCYLPGPAHWWSLRCSWTTVQPARFAEMSPRNWRARASQGRDRQPTCLDFSSLFLKWAIFQVKLIDGHLMWALNTPSKLKLWKCNCISCPIMTPTENFSFGYVVL